MLTAGRVILLNVVLTLLADAWLIVHGRESISSFCGRHFITLVLLTALLFAHFRSWPSRLRNVDPFRWAAQRLRSR